MQSYYSRHTIMPHFTGHARQRSSGLGSLALAVERVAHPVAKKNCFFSAVQSIGNELFVQSLTEIMELATRKKPFARPAETALKTVKKPNRGDMRRKTEH